MASRNNQEEISRNISTSEIECELNQDKYLRKNQKEKQDTTFCFSVKTVNAGIFFAMPSLCTRNPAQYVVVIMLLTYLVGFCYAD